MVNYGIGDALIIIYVVVALTLGLIGSLKKWPLKKTIIASLVSFITLVLLLTFWAKTLSVKAGLSTLILFSIFGPLSAKIHWEYLENQHRLLGLDKVSKKEKDEDKDQN